MDIFLSILYFYLAFGLFLNFYGRLERALQLEMMKIIAFNELVPKWKLISIETFIRLGILTLYPYFLHDFWKRDRDDEALFTTMLNEKINLNKK